MFGPRSTVRVGTAAGCVWARATHPIWWRDLGLDSRRRFPTLPGSPGGALSPACPYLGQASENLRRTLPLESQSLAVDNRPTHVPWAGHA